MRAMEAACLKVRLSRSTAIGVSETTRLMGHGTVAGPHCGPRYPRAPMHEPTTALDDRNAAFWDELCGSSLARSIGITDASAESLARFDAAYMGHYPYLPQYLDHPLTTRRSWRSGSATAR